MSKAEQYFHFTLGPVQGFVAQARRTRDYWGGSFLLSWLAGHAMMAVKNQGGEILFPQADPDYLSWIEGRGKGQPPRQGGIPNRFKAGVKADFDPDKVTGVVQNAWQKLTDIIWRRDLSDLAEAQTRAIWERQTENFWEMTWGLTDDEKDSALLDRLKNWRRHFPPPEPGVKCMVMDGYQELSGEPSPGGAVRAFWDEVREKGSRGMATDLRPGEQLCALAFIKRRFTRYFDQIPGGWRLAHDVPSVAYMAAAPWLAALLEKDCAEEMNRFRQAAQSLQREQPEYHSRIRCLKRARNPVNRPILNMDGSLFFDTLLLNPRVWEARDKAADVLKALRKWREKADMEPVSPFYAILLMDGDSLGSQMSDPDKQQQISSALNRFTTGVAAEVEAHNGFLIYAGGDDVLAILPLENALGCARALRSLYENAFSNYPNIRTSLSGAVEYAHIKTPLGKVLADAHHLLDDIAKDGCGRDAIACRVWKPGGLTLTWALPWATALDDQGVIISRLADSFRKQSDDEEGFASGFFYRLRQLFELIDGRDANGQPLLDEQQQVKLMTMEYLNSGKSGKAPDRARAQEQVDELLNQCRPRVRQHENGNPPVIQPRDGRIEADGALLLRFLATKGVET